ncbi:MAG: dihydroneopterin aldolase [Micavibrio sp.]
MFFCKKKIPADTNHIFIKDMVVPVSIGVFDHEKTASQRVRINVMAEPEIWPDATLDNIDDTVSYDLIVQHVLRLVDGRHIHLVETLAEEIAHACLGEKIRRVTVRIEKLDIYPFAVAGTEITRAKKSRK